MFKPLVVIPTYNHYKELSSMINKLNGYGIDILVIDDGSDVCVNKILTNITNDNSCNLITLKKNKGKGGAVKAGFRYAYNKGYSHCVQIDADGQHDLNDLPVVLSLAKNNPDKLILGNPVFDLKTTPKCRLLGRKLSNFWIAVETMSQDAKDGLCGYRCYPLKETIELITNVNIGNRMDFDPEILIRLRWQGVQVTNFDTKVNYVDKEPSNFNMVRDNFRLSFLFMKLFWIGIAKFFLRNKNGRKSKERWSEKKERGNRFVIHFTFLIYRLLNKKLTQLLLQPVLFYFFCTDKNGRKASVRYLNNIYNHCASKLSIRPGKMAPYFHYNNFMSSLLDKAGIRMPEKRNDFKISFSGFDIIEKLLKEKKGAIFIGAHFGNFDIIRLLSNETEMKLKVLMYRKHARLINDLFANINDEKDNDIIEIESINAATACTLSDYIDDGGFLGILADRVSPGSENKVIRIPFLGKEASFPTGPWIIASILKCPVIFFYAVSNGIQKYEIHFENLCATVNLSSKNRENDIKKHIAEYVYKLENACSMFPYQWYNFYNFWQE